MADEPDASASESPPPRHAARRRTRSDRARERLAGLEGGEDSIVASLKERVYATFTGLAIVLVVASSDHPEPDHAFFALVLGVLGITAAGFVSDVISHLAVHGEFPRGDDLKIALLVSGGALGTVATPAILLFLALLEVMDLETALDAASVVYIVTLAVIGWSAVRRSRLQRRQQVLALIILVALGLLVILLQTLAHAI
ncbi:hypothetical protein [Microbacterium atlanticum]|uniref:hypothetical protein n=1 Tax=Microbacterium atlanticum TaxID=2782168 RepID=UPI0018889562|nr:hypothetical protein [Microbacterium atlanticum]